MIVYTDVMPNHDHNTMEQAFLEAYDAYADAIFRHIALRLGDRERGKELMQDTFLRAWEAIARGTQVQNFRAFLYRIANNLIIDFARRKKRRIEESLEALQESGFDIADEPVNLQARIDGSKALELVQKVKEPNRTALVLRHVDGMEPREIAELLGISANVVSVRIHRGIAELRSLLPSPSTDG